MNNKYLLLFILPMTLLVTCGPAFAQTNVTGNITQNTTWTTTGSPYIIKANIAVNSSVTLTINPGVQVKFDPNYSITVNGTLNAQGTASSMITFTSNKATPAKKDWQAVSFTSTSTNNVIKYAKVEYGNKAITAVGKTSVTVENSEFKNNEYGVFLNQGANGTIKNNTMEQNHIGIGVEGGSRAVIKNNTIINGDHGVDVIGPSTNPSTATINNNSIYGHRDWSVYANSASGNVSSTIINAKNNWWGTTVTSTIAKQVWDYTDGANNPVVDFNGYLDSPNGNPVPGNLVSGPINTNTTWKTANSPYILVGHVTVAPGATLKIDPGVEVRVDRGMYLSVHGTLDAQGTSSQLITFTSKQPTPVKKDWHSVSFSSANTNSVIKYARIEYANWGIHVTGKKSVTIENSQIENNEFGVFLDQGASGTIKNSTIKNSNRGVSVENGSNAAITGSTLTDNRGWAVGILGRATNPSTANMNNNSIYDNSDWNIYTETFGTNLSHTTIDAKNNWWGVGVSSGEISARNRDFTDNGLHPAIDFSGYLDGPNGNPIKVTTVSGVIDSNTTWKKANNSYVVVGHVIVKSGVKLIVESGVRVWFNGDYYIKVDGTLDAQGTITDNITFTGSSSGAWKYIDLSSSSIVKYAQIKHSQEGLRLNNTSPKVEFNILKDNVYGIHLLAGVTSTIKENIIISNDYGIYISPSLTNKPAPLINNNLIFNNSKYNLYAKGDQNYSSQTINAKSNWWGTTTTSQIDAKIYDKNDNPNSPAVNYTPILKSSGNKYVDITKVSAQPMIINTINNETSKISYTLGFAGNVTIKIFDYVSNSLVRTLLNSVAKSAGSNSSIWDGKDDNGKRLNTASYYYTIEVVDSTNNRRGIYKPRYVRGKVMMTNTSLTPSKLNPYRGDTAEIKYDLKAQAYVTIRVGNTASRTLSSRALLDYQPRKLTGNTEIWDGRDNLGNIVGAEKYSAFGWTDILPDNAVVIQNAGVNIEWVRANPYAIYPVYGEISTIKYKIANAAKVTVIVRDPSNKAVRTLVLDQQKAAGEHTIVWDGRDVSGNVVAEAGHYKIEVKTSIANGLGIEKAIGNVTVFK